MYIRRANKTPHTVEQLENLSETEEVNPANPRMKDFLPLFKYEWSQDYYSIFHEIGYWRKFNALHNWFVNRVQDGVDECQLAELDQEILETLLAELKETKETGELGDLEPVSGFFFGSTDVDEWFWKDIDDAIEQIAKILNETDWEKQRAFYRASW